MPNKLVQYQWRGEHFVMGQFLHQNDAVHQIWWSFFKSANLVPNDQDLDSGTIVLWYDTKGLYQRRSTWFIATLSDDIVVSLLRYHDEKSNLMAFKKPLMLLQSYLDHFAVFDFALSHKSS